MIQGKVIGAMGLSCAILSLGIAARAERRNPRSFHVDPRRGLDDATGDAASPVRSPASLVGRLQPGDTVVLARGRYDQPVQFTDSGTAESPITIRSDEGHQPIVSRTTWTITDASHIVIQGLTFRNCSPGLVIGPNASDNAVEDCRFENCPPKGHHGYERAIVGQAPGAHRNRIENSVLTRPYEPLNGEGAEGIQVVEGNQHWVFRGNRISGYMYGLDMGYQHGNGVPGYILVEDNEFFDCHEGLHIKISDNIIRGNYIHDLRNVGWMMSATGVFLRSSPRTTVENNRIERAGGAGIRALGHDQLIRNNLIVDTPTGIWLSKHGYGAATNSHWLVHNTIVGAILPLWLSGGSQAYVFNNIFVGAPDGTSTIFAAGYSPTNPLETATTVFPDPKWFEHYAGASGLPDPPARFVADGNLYSNIDPLPRRYPPVTDEGADAETQTGHNAQGDPMFVDPEGSDYRLRPGSPARAAGRALPNCPHDAADRPRSATRPDSGAFEAGGD